MITSSTSLILACLLAADPATPPDTAEATVRRIDVRLAERFEIDGIIPAPRADDAEFLRRLSLDLVGRIPTSDEVRRFLDDIAPDKRRRAVERLLDDPQHARHFAETWQALLLPEAARDREVRYFQAGFETWLEQRRRERAAMDEIVRRLLEVPITDPLGPPQLVLTDLRKPNPLAFIAAKEADAGKIAADVTRLFLGIRIECAQCHDHPFDDWTRQQFWSQAAFFAGIERRGRGAFSPLVEFADRHAISPPEWDETVPAAFLDGTQPRLDAGQPARAALADWITSPTNLYFARAVVNRVWGQLMGRGLVDPVDDFQAGNPPSHPELLGELAAAFAASGFDLDFLYRAICLAGPGGWKSRIFPWRRASRRSRPANASNFCERWSGTSSTRVPARPPRATAAPTTGPTA
jgi:hypothetical protein